MAVVAIVAVALSGSSGSSPAAGRAAAAAAAVEVVQTNANLTEHLTRMPALTFGATGAAGIPVIDIDDAARYQRIVGVGAALTDASAWLIQDKLTPSARAALMRNLFARGGIGLRVLRVPMAASDFTRGGVPYSYDDLPPGQTDPSLSRFSVAHDDAYIVPALHEALALDPQLDLLATPWSPPAWMKTKQSLSNVAGKGRLRAADYGPLAQYFVKFIQAYADRGIPITAITPENEPGTSVHYPALQLSAGAEARFVARYLAPALKAAGLHPMIYGPDTNWLRAFRARALVGNPAALTALAGLAWHCYQGDPDVMSTYHRLVARLDEIVTECSPGLEPGTTSELLIASIRNWASSVTLWNVALDRTGGPVQLPNRGCARCTGLATIDAATGAVKYGVDYYELGQLGQFVQPGARRIGSNNFVSYDSGDLVTRVDYATPGLDDVAFANPDGTHVLLAYNGTTAVRRFAVRWHGPMFAYSLPASATVTFKWR